MDGHSDLRPVHFKNRRQKAKAAEFISVDLYHHPSNTKTFLVLVRFSLTSWLVIGSSSRRVFDVRILLSPNRTPTALEAEW